MNNLDHLLLIERCKKALAEQAPTVTMEDYLKQVDDYWKPETGPGK